MVSVHRVFNALSEWLEVNVYVDGYEYYQRYERGKVMCELQRMRSPQRREEQRSIFLPDKEIFEETVFDYKVLKQRLREIASLTKGLRISLTDVREEEPILSSFHYEGGMREYVAYLNKANAPLYDEIIYCEGEKDGVLVEVALSA